MVALVTSAAFPAFAYLVLTLQVSSGFPPLYERHQGSFEAEIKPVLPFIFALAAILLAATFLPILFALFGIVSAWCGLRVRRSVQERTNGPLPWLLNPFTVRLFNRWPMLVFDVWTLGILILMGALMYAESIS